MIKILHKYFVENDFEFTSLKNHNFSVIFKYSVIRAKFYILFLLVVVLEVTVINCNLHLKPTTTTTSYLYYYYYYKQHNVQAIFRLTQCYDVYFAQFGHDDKFRHVSCIFFSRLSIEFSSTHCVLK